MKKIVFGLLLLGTLTMQAQQQGEKEVRETIERFFKGFHDQDSTVMQSVIGDKPVLQTIGRNKEGRTVVRHESFDRLIQNIISIPDSVQFEERIQSYQIRIDGPMANAWTPYEFWLNGKFSHCGVNSFQLFNDGSTWKILYLIDTRRREDCP